MGSGNANTINLPKPDVSELVDKLTRYVSSVYATDLDSTQQSIIADTAKKAFTNMTHSEEDHKKIQKGHSEYRFISAADSQEQNEFTVTVVTVKFEGLIEESGTMWNKKKTENYSAAIASLKLNLTNGFKGIACE